MAQRVLKKKTAVKHRSHSKHIGWHMHAWKGIADFLKTSHSILFQVFALFVVVMMGIEYDITEVEWLMIFMAAGILLAAELFNGAIQKDLHHASPHYHKGAEATKDMAYGAVLICSLTAAIIFVTIFGHRVIDFLITFYAI